MSNLPFLVVGLWGIVYVQGNNVCAPRLQSAYLVFFAGVLLTAFGSAYYHLSPTNESLVPDRLPMTIGFAGLFAIVIGEFISERMAPRAVWLLLIIGAASVAYWALTEAHGIGDLRPYAVVQFVPMLLIVIILIVYRAANQLVGYFWLMILSYVLAKVVEFLDAEIYAFTGVVSGHTLKHLFAALTPAILLIAIARRRGDVTGE